MNNHAANINSHFIGSSLRQHFSPMFKTGPKNDQNIDPIPMGRGLSLWMAQGNQAHAQDSIAKNLQEMHQMGIPLSSGSTIICNFSHDPLVNDPPPPTYWVNWGCGNKISHHGNEGLTNSSIPISDVKEVSVSSLFSSQNQSHQPSSATISATALLQKAAQIGATTTDSSFIGNFGLKGSDNNISVEDGNKLCGLYSTTGIGCDVELSVKNISAMNQLEMNPPKRRRLPNEEIIGGETRDFLGVGMRPICHPSSANGWI